MEKNQWLENALVYSTEHDVVGKVMAGDTTTIQPKDGDPLLIEDIDDCRLATEEETTEFNAAPVTEEVATDVNQG